VIGWDGGWKELWPRAQAAQGWHFCISDVCHVLTAEIRPPTSSSSCSPPLHFLLIPMYISLAAYSTTQFNYSQLKRWSRCQLLALIWKINHAVAWWNMSDEICWIWSLEDEGIHRERQTWKGCWIWLITQNHMVSIMKKVPKISSKGPSLIKFYIWPYMFINCIFWLNSAVLLGHFSYLLKHF